MMALRPASGQVKDNAVGVRVTGEVRIYVDGNGLLDGVANLAGEFVGSAHAFFHGEVYRKRSGPAE